jgi:undecaprenyl-diphosphatase
MHAHARADALDDGIDRDDGALRDPFANAPPARTIAFRVVVGAVVLIGSLAIVGTFITSTSLTNGLRRWDESINMSLATNRESGMVTIAEWFSGMADTRPILGIMALVTVVLALCRQWKAMLLIPIAMFVEISGFLAVNYIVGRPRPNVDKIGPLPGTYSFPSGHVAATFVCWLGPALLVLAFGRTRLSQALAGVGSVMVVFTAWSRVYLGMHHTLDVVVGVVLGIAALGIAIRSLNMQLGELESESRP